jgi:DNA-binding response OmpR family regulator
MVEEEIAMIERVQARFSHAGFEMLSAYDGRLGLQMAKDKSPDLIITDAMVPLMSGYDLCKAIKNDVDTKSIPIVVLTEKHRMEESFMFLGIKDFINKPFSMDELEAVVRKKLNISQLMHLQKTKILINGRPEILSCCEQLLKSDNRWAEYLTSNKDDLLENAIKHTPDVIILDLLMPDVAVDEMVKKFKLIPELKNTTILTYYISAAMERDHIAVQAHMIEVLYMKNLAQEAGAKEYLGPFNPVTFLHLIDIYRRDFNFII